MNIIQQDFKKGIIKLRIEDLDDLWYLSHIIDQGDLVRGKTTRKIKIGEGENSKMIKKTFTMKIEAETIDFGKGGDTLRINGKIKEGPEDVPKDSYQAIALEQGSEFILGKKKWLSYQKQKIKEATEKKYNYLICLFDREEAIFALTKNFGFEIILKIRGEAEKKSKTIDIKKEFYQEIIKILEEYNTRYSPEKIILASPAFYKEDLIKKVNSQELKKKIVPAICSDVNEKNLDEVVKRPELANILKSSKAREEQLLVDNLLSEINKEGLAAYGLEEVKKAVLAGAANKIILTDEFISRKREESKFLEIDELMKIVDSLNGEVHIISSENEAGKRLNGLGGIAAMLRYRVKW